MIQTVFLLSGEYAEAVYSLRNRVLSIQTKKDQHPAEIMQTINDWRIEWDTPRWIRIVFIEGVETKILIMEARKVDVRYLLNDAMNLLVDGGVVGVIYERNTPSITVRTISI